MTAYALNGWTEGFILFALGVGCGALGPWWLFIVPAFAYGFYRAPRPKTIRTAMIAFALSWVIPAFIQDAAVGLRISLRIGGIMNAAGILPASLAIILAYVITGLIAALLASLSALIGSSLSATVRTYARARSSVVKTPGDSPAV